MYTCTIIYARILTALNSLGWFSSAAVFVYTMKNIGDRDAAARTTILHLRRFARNLLSRARVPRTRVHGTTIRVYWPIRYCVYDAYV